MNRTLVILLAAAGLACFFLLGPKAGPPTGELMEEFIRGKPLPRPAFILHHAGSNEPIHNELYGEYINPGTNNFSYKIKDSTALKEATPEGVYPNAAAVYKDPVYKEMEKKGLLEKGHWPAFEDQSNLQASFFIWANAHEAEATKQFFIAILLEKAGHIIPAIHAHQVVATHFPKAPIYSKDGTFVWYPGEASIANIKRLLTEYPEIGYTYEGAKIGIQNGGDTNLLDDVFTVTPGKFVKKTPPGFLNTLKKRFQPAKIITKTRSGKVQLVRYDTGWQMQVNGKPFTIRSVSYSPTKIGLGPKSDSSFSYRWMSEDANKNGKNDAAYDAWVDANKNGTQDANEPSVGDFQLLKEMGANAVRLYHVPKDNQYNPAPMKKELSRDLYRTFGMCVLVGDFLGAYTLGSGADWETGTDYTDPVQKERMKKIIRDMVADLKDEPFVLLWILGNENNMNSKNKGVNATRTNASMHPVAYAAFLNEVAEMIHQIDPDHPVAVGNLETILADVYNQHAQALDIMAINSYRGEKGFGSLWDTVARVFDRPVFITEYGCDAYHNGQGENEDEQKTYIEGNFRDIVLNQIGGPGADNSIGGSVFSYLDEWWKDTHSEDPESSHQTKPSGFFPFPDGHNHEEWFGIMGQGDGKNSPFERHPRKAYDYFKKLWSSLPR